MIPTIRAFRARYGTHLYQRYGFLDAVNPSFTFTDVPLRHGRIIEDLGWVADDYLGIDQGPIVAMIENYRSGLIWKVMRRNPHIRRGLERAGFTGGWLAQPPEAPVVPLPTVSQNQGRNGDSPGFSEKPGPEVGNGDSPRFSDEKRGQSP